jgi:hypothetical protein
MDCWDAVAQAKHDEAEAERRFRALRRWGNKLAKAYADARLLHAMRLWKSSEVDKELEEAKFKANQSAQLKEQIETRSSRRAGAWWIWRSKQRGRGSTAAGVEAGMALVLEL